ncbi:adenosylcobinamide kinase /adenosylcobinamide-phosphate guanylyltransferase [Herbihabitans rhizosphaerae]|uniref:Adenosylcobinamide kinase n=1 Tax=Herbihabitans rhizosphaerae TaxID=1872711 RepID=A0A4Q7KR33_9PSEU|nr:adenosylcobinamide kinase /adenosylcobinamide-phosphate guanylyltransferase [Herbihabitans rhizosphaerae]
MLGGARSGKSAHAEGLLSDEPAIYVATARRDPSDAEWTERIAEHERRRPSTWDTVEAPTTDTLVEALRHTGNPLLVDDLTTWLAGAMDDASVWDGGADELAAMRAERDRVLQAITACECPLIMVTNEVGLGIVPATRSGRLFRDELGWLNAAVAERCTDVLLMVAGIQLRLR